MGGNHSMEPLIAAPPEKIIGIIYIYRGLSHDGGNLGKYWRGGTDVIRVRFLQISDMGRGKIGVSGYMKQRQEKGVTG